MIVIVGLGPGTWGQLSVEAGEALQSAKNLWLRTAVHPTVEALRERGIAFVTFDEVYEQAASFDDVYQHIVDRLLAEKEVTYAVPGHPLIGERTVELLLAEAEKRNIPTKVIPSMSFVDVIWPALGISGDGVQLVDALALECDQLQPNQPYLLMQVYNRLVASELKLRLMNCYPDEHEIVVVRGAGIPGWQRILRVPLYRLDNLDWLDHLTSVYLPPVAPGTHYDLADLVTVMKRLLGPNGCPWDRKQDHHSLKKYLVEEAEEVLGAIDSGDMDHLCEELGDLLLQIVFHAQLAAEEGYFNIHDVIKAITTKMIRRHPHVFGDVSADNVETVLQNWEEIKRAETREHTSHSALRRAQWVQQSARNFGFDWPDVYGPAGKVFEEIGELVGALGNGSEEDRQREFGDVLFALVNLGRFLNIDPEVALSQTVERFEQRFQRMEEKAMGLGKTLGEMSLEEMDVLWEEVKEEEK